ncbi:MAG TPA: allantoinase AllB [Myxococcales bacterium]
MNFDFVVRSRRVLTPQGMRDAGVAIDGEKIAGILHPDQIPSGSPQLDAGNSVVMPGLVDSHAHINEPGRTEWEGFETATRAAAAGGITTLVDMPLNSIPVTTSVEALEVKMCAAAGRIWVDCGFWGGLVPGNAKSLQPLLEAGVAGIKAFLVHSGIDDFPKVAEKELRQAMPVLTRSGLPLLVHAEIDLSQSSQAPPRGDPRSYATYLASRPPEMEVEAVRQMIGLCRELRTPVHVVHLSSARVLNDAIRARSEGLPLTLETCPHYLILAAEDVPQGKTEFKCAPPIREKENRDLLWKALDEGHIDLVVSDHSPCLPALKLPEVGNFLTAWGGISSLQFGLPMVWTHARKRGFSIAQLSKWMCAAPAHLAGLTGRKGAIAAGHDADLVIWNPEKGFTLEAQMIHHRHPVTPYLGHSLQGVVKMTFLRGRKIYEEGNFLGPPSGRAVLRTRESSTAGHIGG